jgi:hypothetical protein
MSNHAYASVWCRGFGEETLLDMFERLLATVPFSAEWPGFAQLIIRALEPTEIPLVERDLRAVPATPAELVALARDYLHADSAYETLAYWDLWTYQPAAAQSPGTDSPLCQLQPQRLELACFGEGYDDGVYEQAGHFQVDLGFEHLFTGHAGLLGFQHRAVVAPEHPVEAAFLHAMEQPANLSAYQQKTQENIRTLLHWVREIQRALPVERYRLWSEGEENFEARLDEIVAAR